MVRAARYAFVVLALAFAAGIVLQVYFIGLGLFAGSENLVLHTTFGWILHLAPLLVLIAAALAGAGRTRILQAVALVVVVWVVPILAAVRADLPEIAALHPVGAYSRSSCRSSLPAGPSSSCATRTRLRGPREATGSSSPWSS